MSRHSSMGSYQQTMSTVWNHPLPEQYLQTLHSQPMSPQYSNRSYASTSSSSYGSNQGSYVSTSPPQYDSYNARHSAPSHARHHSQGAAYTNDMCISPLELHSQNHFDSRHSYENQRVVPSSDHSQIAEYEAYHNRVVAQGTERRRHDDSSSSTTEKDNSKRVACEWEGCNATFSRKADVNRHLTSTHRVEFIDCDVNNCARTGENGFARKDHLLEHKRGYHCMEIPKKHIKNVKSRHEG